MFSNATHATGPSSKPMLGKIARLSLIGVALFGFFRLGENMTSEWRFERATTDHRPLSERMNSTVEIANKYLPEKATTVSRAEQITSQGEAAARDQLRDPWSAEFEDLELAYSPVYDSWFVCGRVNAKNGFGAYLGFRQFAIAMRRGSSASETRFGDLVIFDPLTNRLSDSQMDYMLAEIGAKCGLGSEVGVLSRS